jgi:hypothetical protein
MAPRLLLPALLALAAPLAAQQPAPIPSQESPAIHDLVAAASPARIEADIRKLVGFGTRHTLSDTLSATRGIGAARRWIFAEFQRISQACGGCLDVRYVSEVKKAEPTGRIPVDVEIVNVVAVLRGKVEPNRYVLLAGDIDSRVTNVLNAKDSSPGANDNASGIAALLEAARLLSKHTPNASIAFAALSAEEQGLFGGEILARHAKANNWRIDAIINNDMVGNIAGIDGVIENTKARVFAPGLPADTPPPSCAAFSPTAASSTRRRGSWRATSITPPIATSRISTWRSSTASIATGAADITRRSSTRASRRPCVSWNRTRTTTSSIRTFAWRTASPTAM